MLILLILIILFLCLNETKFGFVVFSFCRVKVHVYVCQAIRQSQMFEVFCRERIAEFESNANGGTSRFARLSAEGAQKVLSKTPGFLGYWFLIIFNYESNYDF